jgi:hypothetical protein
LHELKMMRDSCLQGLSTAVVRRDLDDVGEALSSCGIGRVR